VELTEFQKLKQQEWDAFSKKYPFSWKQELKDSWLYVVCFIGITFFAVWPLL